MLKWQRKSTTGIYWLCGLISVTLGCCNGIEAQTLQLQDNSTAKAAIASQALTRIAVDHDRIAVLRGVDGAYTDSQDNQQGAVFLKPTAAYKNKPFYIFITTELNHNYLLELTPSDQLSAGMLILQAEDPAVNPAPQEIISSSYLDKLTALVTHMANHQTLPNFKVSAVHTQKITTVGTALSLRLKRIYRSDPLQGAVYEVTNRSHTTITLTESLFNQPGDLAIALQNHTLAPHRKTLLYKVTRHE